MKSLKLLLAGTMLFLAGVLQAQISVSLQVGSAPPWGPSGYSDVRYYYLPEIQTYYDIETSMFIYNSGGSWIQRNYLPRRYRNYDLYSGYKVVLSDYRGNTPYMHYKHHKRQYSRSYRGQHQQTIGERPGNNNSRGHYKDKGDHNKKVSHWGKKSGKHGNDNKMQKRHEGKNGRK